VGAGVTEVPVVKTNYAAPSRGGPHREVANAGSCKEGLVAGVFVLREAAPEVDHRLHRAGRTKGTNSW
jgi:hypothetical protein